MSLLLKYFYNIDLIRRGVMPSKIQQKFLLRKKQKNPLRGAILTTGFVGPKLKEYLQTETNYLNFEDALKNSVDLILCDDEGLKIAGETVFEYIPKIKSKQPCVLWIKDKSMDVNEYLHLFDKIYISSENNDSQKIKSYENKIQFLDCFIDLKAYNPGNLAKRTLASIGIIGEPVISAALEQWIKREDILLWKTDYERSIAINSKLAPYFAGFCKDIKDADSNFTTHLLLNITSEMLSVENISLRLAHGQIAFNVYRSRTELVATNPILKITEPVDIILKKALDHCFISNLQINAIRFAVNHFSLDAAMSRIISENTSGKMREKGVSVIVCTNKPDLIDNILGNYLRQEYENKELILVLHSNEKVIKEWKRKTKAYPDIRIYKRLPGGISFGKCLNFAITLTTKQYIAKFDDDDYYAPKYLSDIIDAFKYTDADIVGKLSFYTFLSESGKFVIRKPGNEYTYCNFLPGATLVIKRNVLSKVLFRDVPRDIDGLFGRDCISAGLKMYSIGAQNLLVIRYPDKNAHTWKANDMQIIHQSLEVEHKTFSLETAKEYITV